MTFAKRKAYPTLPNSYKGRFPFKICTTSFIYPDDYIPNVKLLGPYVDEIELLMFESRGLDPIPPREVIAELGKLGEDLDLSFNVHLPTDVSISDTHPEAQHHAVQTLARVIDRVSPLNPSALILHVPGADPAADIRKWQDRIYRNLVKLLSGIDNRKVIAIETLDYPLELLQEAIFDLDLAICLDLGHLMVYDYDVMEVFNRYAFKTSVLHLHGVEDSRDHISLDRLSARRVSTVLRILKKFTGVVSLEVFSYDNLKSSLNFLDHHWT